MSFDKLGYDEWCVSAFEEYLRPGWEVCRVMTVNRTNWIISDGKSDIRAELTGRLNFSAESPLDRPAVGDWVIAQFFDDRTFAVIDEVLPRRSELKRKAAGATVEYQLFATNVDRLLIMQSCDRDFNLRRLERYLVMARDGNVEPVLLLSKADQVSEGELSELILSVAKLDPDLPVVAFSSLEARNLDAVRALLQPQKTCCLMGSSGVGKTTLLNILVGQNQFETGEVRASDHRGRHTTTSRHLIVLDGGALLIDTPGIRELGTIGAEAGIGDTFADIIELADFCRFSDCNHEQESGCAVMDAISAGNLDEARLISYKKLQRETLRHEMSLAERRKKDKATGKLYKSIIQSKKDRR